VQWFSYDISIYCAFFDKSTNFGTNVEQIWMGSHWPTAPWQPFSKMLPADNHKLDKVWC